MFSTAIGPHNMTMITYFVPSQRLVAYVAVDDSVEEVQVVGEWQCTSETTAPLPLAACAQTSPQLPLPCRRQEIWKSPVPHCSTACMQRCMGGALRRVPPLMSVHRHPLQHPVYYPLLRHRPVVGSIRSQRILQMVLVVVS